MWVAGGLGFWGLGPSPPGLSKASTCCLIDPLLLPNDRCCCCTHQDGDTRPPVAVEEFAYFQVYDYDVFWDTDADNVLSGLYAGSVVSAAGYAWHAWHVSLQPLS